MSIGAKFPSDGGVPAGRGENKEHTPHIEYVTPLCRGESPSYSPRARHAHMAG